MYRKSQCSLARSLTHSPFSSTSSCLVLYPHRAKPLGSADHSSRLRGIDVRVRGGSSRSRLILHTQAGAEPKPGERKPGVTKLPGKKKSNWSGFHPQRLTAKAVYPFLAEVQILDHTLSGLTSQRPIHECTTCYC